jgi:hypothetical protein
MSTVYNMCFCCCWRNKYLIWFDLIWHNSTACWKHNLPIVTCVSLICNHSSFATKIHLHRVNLRQIIYVLKHCVCTCMYSYCLCSCPFDSLKHAPPGTILVDFLLILVEFSCNYLHCRTSCAAVFFFTDVHFCKWAGLQYNALNAKCKRTKNVIDFSF